MRKVQSILVIDDEESFLQDFQKIFRDLEPEIRIVTATDRDFLRRIEDETYDVVVLDLSMPAVTGPDVLAALRKIDRHSVVVAWTALTPSDDLVRQIREKTRVVFKRGRDLGLAELLGIIKDYLFKEIRDLNLLIVEEDPKQVELFTEELKSAQVQGERIIHAQTPDEANCILERDRERVPGDQVDVILVDVFFGDAPRGIAFTRDLRKAGVTKTKAVVLLITPEDKENEEVLRNSEFHNSSDVKTVFYKQSGQLKDTTQHVVDKWGPTHVPPQTSSFD